MESHRRLVASLLVIATSVGFKAFAKDSEIKITDGPVPGSRCIQVVKEFLSPEWLEAMEEANAGFPANIQKLREKALKRGIKVATLNQEILRAHNDKYNHELPETKVTDQKQSGRCWLFAGCNVQSNRLFAEGKVGKAFEFSEVYPHFYSQLERTDKWLFTTILRMKPHMDQPSLRRVLSTENAASDGGEFEYFDFLVNKYGLVPKEAMPETFSSKNTAGLLQAIDIHLAGITKQIEKEYGLWKFKKNQNFLDQAQLDRLLEIRRRGMEGVYNILVTHLGKPPKSFKFKDPSGKTKTYTPQSFAKDFVGFNRMDYVRIAAVPTLETGKRYELMNSAIGIPDPHGKTYNLNFVNVSPDRMQQILESTIDLGAKNPNRGYSVWFAADVTRDVDSKSGIMHPDIFQPEKAYGTEQVDGIEPIESRYDNFFYRIAQADHAMTFTGFDRPDKKGPTIKYRVKNSWGVKAGTRGYYHMYTPWFKKYVYEIIVPRAVLNERELALVDGQPQIISPEQAP